MAGKERWTCSNTCVYNIGYHLIWCPKYRRNILQSDVAKRLKELLNEKASDIGVVIKVMEIMPDHLHLFVKTKPTARRGSNTARSDMPCTVGRSINSNSLWNTKPSCSAFLSSMLIQHTPRRIVLGVA